LLNPKEKLLNRYIDTIPDDALCAANECGFPLLVAPESLKFSSINRILSQKANKLPQSTERYTAFADLLQKNAALPAFLRLLSSYLKKDVAYYDNFSAKRILGNRDCPAPDYDEFTDGDAYKNYFSRIVQIGGNICGTLLILCNTSEIETDEIASITVDYAASMIGITQQKSLPARFRDENWKDQFVAELLRGISIVSDDEIRRRGRLSAYDFFQPTTVAVIETGDHRNGTIQRLEQILEKELPLPHNVLQLSIENDFVVLWGGEKQIDALTDYLKKILTISKEHSIISSAGIGNTTAAPKLLCDSYRHARQTVQIGSCFGTGEVHCYDKMQVWDFLYSHANNTKADSVVDGVLGKLLEYDSQKPSYALLPTLQAIVQSGFNLTVAAEALFVHYNTLKYRYAKICEIINMDLSDFHNQMQVYLAISLLRLRRNW